MQPAKEVTLTPITLVNKNKTTSIRVTLVIKNNKETSSPEVILITVPTQDQ